MSPGLKSSRDRVQSRSKSSGSEASPLYPDATLTMFGPGWARTVGGKNRTARPHRAGEMTLIRHMSAPIAYDGLATARSSAWLGEIVDGNGRVIISRPRQVEVDTQKNTRARFPLLTTTART